MRSTLPPRARRYSFVAPVELTDLQTESQIRGQASDLSLYGCYVETAELPPLGLRVKIRIVHRGAHFVALGKVANVRPSSGVGIRFTHIEPADQLTLDKWLSESRSR